ncbi:ATP-binding protein [Paenibacillus agilis]|uniref:histidine kinase n=1 Tax=Paenibacillus agilis TaxID=3020863 RepID=A0A559J113_9BACL|nr:ATP-binding protein [Paenibacillus agilis]TVX93536.1 response regulator [Paenibacillus agilis]
MMKIRKKLFILLLFLVVITGIRLLWLYALSTPNQPIAAHGQFDLTDWNFEQDGNLKLNGEWEWHPNELLDPHSNHAPEAEYIDVPGNWSDAHTPPKGSPQGYGSYRLRIKLNDSDNQMLALHVPALPTSSEVYVDGKQIAHSGKPAASAHLYKPWGVPYIANFQTDSKVVDIVIHIANYENAYSGGITQGITLGLSDAIQKRMWIALGTEMTVFIIMIIHTIYVVLVYWIGIRIKGLVYFALLSFSTSISILVDDHRLLLQFVNIDYWWSIKIQFLGYLGSSIALLQMSKSLFTSFKRPTLIRWFTLMCLLMCLYIFIAPIDLITPIIPVYTLILYTPFLITVWAALKDVFLDKEDAIYLAIGIVCVAANLLWGIAKNEGYVDMYYYPIDIIISFLAFVGFWIKKYFSTTVQLAHTTEQLTKEHTLKDEFLANTSHELRNPLHSIINLSQDVLDSDKETLSDESKKHLELVVTVGRRMSNMLTDLLDVARLRENRVQLHASPIAVQTVATGVLDMLKHMTAGKPVRLINEIPFDFPEVQADEERVIQILFNLLHNAIKHTSAGTISIRAEVRNNTAYIHVVDTGIGIEDGMQHLLFLPYEQGENSSSSGLGLGLHISKQLVELHGGTISCSSVPEKGSTFTFTLPLAEFVNSSDHVEANLVPFESSRPLASTVRLPASVDSDHEIAASIDNTDRPTHIGVGITVLAVDDDSVNLDILSRILRAEHYQVITATNGNEALTMIQENDVDLVIADVMMPGISGYELTRNIRQHYSISELPILLLTARSTHIDIETGFLAGANDYVIKPMDSMELRSRVRALTDFKHSVNERLKMEAAWLQAQIQPHFLFNTLNSIAALSDIDIDRMRALLEEFGHYLRASYDSRNAKRLVPLEHEISLVHSYLYIEKERFEDRLHIQWEVDDTVNIHIPPLSIQPLVENAVRHGIMKRMKGGTITIRIASCPDGVNISIIDDGIGMEEENVRMLFEPAGNRSTGIGLINTDRRLKQAYGNGLHIHSRLGEGTEVSFVVPLRNERKSR